MPKGGGVIWSWGLLASNPHASRTFDLEFVISWNALNVHLRRVIVNKQVRIFDTTLRDGEQTPGVRLSADQKCEIAQALEDFGVSTIEAGFPASSPGDADAVGRVARSVRNCEVAALARCCNQDCAHDATILLAYHSPDESIPR